jgi:TM2 domain-containing membrane protein YozV
MSTLQTSRAMLYDAKKKSVGVAYALWIVGGWCGAHRFYLGRPLLAVCQLGLAVAGVVLCLWVSATNPVAMQMEADGRNALLCFSWAFITGGWLFLDLLTIPRRVRVLNTALAESLG